MCSPNIWASQRWVELVSVAPGVGEWRNRGPSTPSQRVWKIEVGRLCGGLRLGAVFAWVPQLDDVQSHLRQSGEGEDHVPQYCHCLCHSSAPGSLGTRGGVSTVVSSQSKGP